MVHRLEHLIGLSRREDDACYGGAIRRFVVVGVDREQHA
jgi:hypothetical protein